MPQGAEDEVAKFALTVNGSRRIVDVDRDTPLLWVLRDTLDLRGTKYGCGRGVCGACTVHADGQAIRSCVTTLESVAQQQITTIEALSKDGNHPVQRAWSELDSERSPWHAAEACKTTSPTIVGSETTKPRRSRFISWRVGKPPRVSEKFHIRPSRQP